MNRTDRELNSLLDDATDELRAEKLDAAVVAGAAQRVWTRMTGEQAATQAGLTPVEQIRNCDDFQALIPVYLQGSLSSARTMLLEDHTRECVPCRKALKEARHGNQRVGAIKQLEVQKAKAAISSHRMAVLRWGVAAAVVLGFGLLAWPWIQRFTNSVSTLNAIVEAANGGVYKVTDNKTQTVRIGEKLLKGEHLRTAKNAGAVVKLGDGTLVEMRERAEFSISENTTGTTINLERGNIIVEAAKQKDRKLFVATDEALVSVTGTIFSVNQGAKGARVSVIEGEVHVGQAGQDKVLLAGDQVATHKSIERIAVREEIKWSRNAEQYSQVLAAAEAARKQIDEQVSLPGNRYSTRLLDLAPENTVIYVAIPNLSRTLAEADRILQENVQKNPELREWYEQEEGGGKAGRAGRGKHGLSQAIDLAKEFGGYLGDEIVIAAQAGAKGGGPEEPVILAELKDPVAFRIFLQGQLDQLGEDKKHVRIIDDPSTALAAENNDSRKGEFFVWIDNDLLVASSQLGSLKSLSERAAREKQGAKPFASSPFHAHIASLYREGAGLVIAADLDRLMAQAFKSEKAKQSEIGAVEQLGVTNLRYFVVEVKEKDGKPFNRAVVSFNEGQRGVTSWLAAPGPMGALEFISPDANLVAAFVVKEPSALVDDLLNTLKTADEKAWEELQKFQTEQGIDLRNDFAAPLGGEYAFAIDGPVLPTPSWKAVFQVDDQTHLQQSLETMVSKLNAELAKDGKQGLAWTKDESAAKTFYTLKSLDFNVEVNYAYAYGYLIAAPSRALVENAIKYKESGYTVLQSPKFKATLPEDKQANFSALVYQNIGSVMKPLANTMKGAMKGGGAHGPKEMTEAVKGLLGDKAGLAYVYALNDRMIFSINSEDGPIGLSPSDLLGLPGSSGLGHLMHGLTR